MPSSMAPLTRHTWSEAITSRPSNDSAGVAPVRVPRPTIVPGLATIKPASAKPMKAMNSPTPPATAANSDRGTAFMISWRTPSSVKIRKATPDRNTQPSAVCQATPMLLTTV